VRGPSLGRPLSKNCTGRGKQTPTSGEAPETNETAPHVQPRWVARTPSRGCEGGSQCRTPRKSHNAKRLAAPPAGARSRTRPPEGDRALLHTAQKVPNHRESGGNITVQGCELGGLEFVEQSDSEAYRGQAKTQKASLAREILGRRRRIRMRRKRKRLGGGRWKRGVRMNTFTHAARSACVPTTAARAPGPQGSEKKMH